MSGEQTPVAIEQDANLWRHRPFRLYLLGEGTSVAASSVVPATPAVGRAACIDFGLTHDDPEVVERGRRTLRRLQNTHSF
ncbi:hypothetical protein [Streptomyces sp. NPDC017940]|uniref:hypothetical protein n=1 Tax=Streptomyces sp. NPDC017940 TaxID=3365017 RepID=UPI00378B7DCB